MFKQSLIWYNRYVQKRKKGLDLTIKDRSWSNVLLGLIFKTVVLCFFGLMVIFPFYLMLVVALTSDKVVLNIREPILKSDGWHFENFRRVLEDGKYLNAIWINSLVTILSIILRLFFTVSMGYAFSLKKWKLKKLFWFIFLAVLILPESALLIGQYRVVVVANWNQPEKPAIILGLTMPFVASVFSGFMFRTAFEAIPPRIKESAFVDGCTGLRYFLKIAFPMVRSTTWTVSILTAFAAWNSYLWPLLLLTNRPDLNINLWVLAQGTDGNAGQSDEQIRVLLNLKMAAAILAILPMFIVYFLFRKRIMKAVGSRANTIKG